MKCYHKTEERLVICEEQMNKIRRLLASLGELNDVQYEHLTSLAERVAKELASIDKELREV